MTQRKKLTITIRFTPYIFLSVLVKKYLHKTCPQRTKVEML
jgi:phage terminase large subunit-like protein